MGRKPKKETTVTADKPELQVKVFVGNGAIGPGQITLLEMIDRDGSISAAARGMKMSFRRAWQLIDALNSIFGQPVVKTKTGGSKGGSAKLTGFGRELVTRYRKAMDVIDKKASPLLNWLDDCQGPKK